MASSRRLQEAVFWTAYKLLQGGIPVTMENVVGQLTNRASGQDVELVAPNTVNDCLTDLTDAGLLSRRKGKRNRYVYQVHPEQVAGYFWGRTVKDRTFYDNLAAWVRVGWVVPVIGGYSINLQLMMGQEGAMGFIQSIPGGANPDRVEGVLELLGQVVFSPDEMRTLLEGGFVGLLDNLASDPAFMDKLRNLVSS